MPGSLSENQFCIRYTRSIVASGYGRRPLPASGYTAGAGVPRDQVVAALKRERARVKDERHSLRDAAAFFTKKSS
jgi:transposase-like protein